MQQQDVFGLGTTCIKLWGLTVTVFGKYASNLYDVQQKDTGRAIGLSLEKWHI